MSSSSAPDPILADVEEAEELQHAAPREQALGIDKSERGGGWVTAAWALPGGLWLGFFVVNRTN